MIADAKPNEPTMDTTSMRYEKISAAKPEKPKIEPAHVETEMSEEALLRHHADSAMGAMRDLLTKIHGDMSRVGDPREWAERYPWATVAAAAAAGFVAAKVITPRKTPAAPPAAAPYYPPAPPPTSASSVSDEVDALAAAAAERARYEAYLRDAARARSTAAPEPPRESMWTPLVEMAKSAAARYIMSAAQAGIAAFAAAHAAKAGAEEGARDAVDDADRNGASDDATGSGDAGAE